MRVAVGQECDPRHVVAHGALALHVKGRNSAALAKAGVLDDLPKIIGGLHAAPGVGVEQDVGNDHACLGQLLDARVIILYYLFAEIEFLTVKGVGNGVALHGIDPQKRA